VLNDSEGNPMQPSPNYFGLLFCFTCFSETNCVKYSETIVTDDRGVCQFEVLVRKNGESGSPNLPEGQKLNIDYQ